MAISLHTKLCDMLDIEYPVMAFNHCRDVVAAVGNAGGCGVLGALALPPGQIGIEANWIKEHSDKPFGIDLVFPSTAPEMITQEQLMAMIPQGYKDFMDSFKAPLGIPEQIWGGAGMDVFMELGIGGSYESQMKQLDAALETKPAVIAAALGFNREIVDRCHSAGAKCITLVGNVKNAKRAAEAGVDIIVAQGTEAGGHTGRIGTLALVPQVVDAVSPVPVLAAGGIADGRGLVAALALGAVGVWTGTMWLTAHESPLVDFLKDKVIEATDEDAVISNIYTGKTARVLKNKYIDRWQEPDAPATLPMPLQNLYSPMPLFLSTENSYSASLFDKPGVREYATSAAGNAAGLIKQRKSVRKIMEDMMTEAVEILGE
jgi:NAD(P)H-dependent flavin oxidoreductase YrpB (nitropropane dioxygenase family)